MKGKLFWALWLVSAAVLYFFENNAGTRLLLAASFLLPLFLMLPLVIKGGKVQLEIDAPKRAKRGGTAEISVRVDYDNPAFRFLRTELVLEAEYVMTGDKEAVRAEYGESETAGAELFLKHCGMVRLKAGLWGRDAFCICENRLIATSETAFFSEPNLFVPFVNLVEDTDSSWEGERFSSVSPGNDPSETFGIREYLPGDPIRQIHWKLSEKTQKTMLRELGMPVSSRAVLLLDIAGSGCPDEMTELFFSVCRAMVLSGQSCSLVWKHKEQQQPRIFEAESEQDLSLAMNEFFGAAPERDESIRLSGFGGSFAHGLLISAGIPSDDEVMAFDGRLTAAFPFDDASDGADPAFGGAGSGGEALGAAGSGGAIPGGFYLLPFRPESFRDDMIRIDF